MKIIVASMYEQGHHPLSSLALAATIRESGHEADVFDYDRQESYEQDLLERLARVDALVISVPMHTASVIALELLAVTSVAYPTLPTALFGLYATVLGLQKLPTQVSLLASGETRSDVIAWLSSLGTAADASSQQRLSISRTKELSRTKAPKLDRKSLPGLDHYAKLNVGETQRLVGYTEASRGCLHSCTHCPVPVIYGGRIRINDVKWVLDDIDALVVLGAEHITFGDPDFFNAPIHSMRILRAMHERHPSLTFDATIKVQHLLEHQKYLGELAELGCAFVISAFEHVSSEVLLRLKKEHTREDIETALSMCREVGIEIRPSLLPFTPWTTPDDIVDLFKFIVENDLIQNVDPIQLTIRLLVPRGSLLLVQECEATTFVESGDDTLSYAWKSHFSELDHLAAELSQRLEEWLGLENAIEVFDAMYRVSCEILGRSFDAPNYGQFGPRSVPQLTESWFCCAEPATKMLARTAGQVCDA